MTSIAGASLLLMPSAPPDTLPIATGTAFTATDTSYWTAQFTVGSTGGTLVGAWTAYNGSGSVSLEVVNGTVSKPPNVYLCPRIVLRWQERNGTVDAALTPGPHTVFWTTGYCSAAERIVVTQTIEIIPS